MKKSFGFNLIEMAMVLVIVGLLMRSILIPLPRQIDQKKIVATQQHLEEIKEALLGFAVLHGRLPEPESDLAGAENGLENPLITYNEGELPWASLGVGRYDAWGNSFRYRVRYFFLSSYPSANRVVVKDAHSKTTLIELSDNDGYSAIIFSKGKNAKGDKKNCVPEPGIYCDNVKPPNGSYSQGDYVEDPDVKKHFDDILIWLPKNIVVNRLVTVGKWPPP
jgi:prepilin-type N-terminal cleavage/methylation domain-containing protein